MSIPPSLSSVSSVSQLYSITVHCQAWPPSLPWPDILTGNFILLCGRNVLKFTNILTDELRIRLWKLKWSWIISLVAFSPIQGRKKKHVLITVFLLTLLREQISS